MLFDIDGESDIPIYEQIVRQVIFGVASGTVRPGEMLPGVRDVAMRHVVNFNTVAKAYQELQREGVVVARAGRGMEVTPEAPALCRTRRKEIVQNRIREALQEAVHSALTPDELRRLVEEELARANGKRR
jgi:DNA-binding transcriptional regulator YhcF (GntR family)